MKKFLVCLFLVTICNADIVYYNGIYKMVNCKIIANEENQYIVETYTENGNRNMVVSKSLVNVLDYKPVDTTQYTEIIKMTKNNETNITQLNKIERQKYVEEQDEKKELIKEIKIKDSQPIKGDYYIKTNIPLLATGVALSTQGLISLFSTGKLSKMINEYESEGLLPESYIDDIKSDLTKAYIYGTVFTIAGAIDIYYSFEKVEIRLEGNNLNMSYSF